MNREMLKTGYVQVYTGNSKGKTTAALGLSFRAMGRGLKTYIGQFMKGQKYAELVSAAGLCPAVYHHRAVWQRDLYPCQEPTQRGRYQDGADRVGKSQKSHVFRRV